MLEILGSVYFAASSKSSAVDILSFELYLALSRYKAEFVTLAVWEVSIPAVQVIVGSALSIVVLGLL